MPSPIFVIGSARNGTTNLENTIGCLSKVATVEHWLHYGSCESSLYMNKQYWGDISDISNYIHFLYRYASSDYFQLANGDIDYHLQQKRDNFYEFFFDLMDRHCEKEGKPYWVAKLDPHFFMDREEQDYFFSILKKRYREIKFVRIQRDFKDSFRSYLRMEGKNFKSRQKVKNLLPVLLLQASRYALVYSKCNRIKSDQILDIVFEGYVIDQKKSLNEIVSFLGLEKVDIESLTIDRYQINSSFKEQEKEEFSEGFQFLMRTILQFLMNNKSLARLIWKTYYKLKKESVPIFHRLIQYTYFKPTLLAELSDKNAQGLIDKIKDKNTSEAAKKLDVR